ncbi:MAG: CDP-diacylglycerol--serine O-phosphatidyltransferase [Candidatus Omnitrophica bacterium]|nr:CDP-diacylglycerol--serine O-phosphatidyltransferase [Candidatus Omnitrophota bacterium]
MMNFFANCLTTLSLLFGFISIIFSLESHFTFASWAIILSVIFDGLDGQVARMNPVPSEFGKELDSLVDVVAFGVAPVVLGYIFVYSEFHFWPTVVLFIYLLCSILRLAKYNITPKEKMQNYFYGLPTTMSGGTLASFILIYRRFTQSPPPVLFFLLLAAVLAFLMVSRVKYANLDGMKQMFGKSKFLLLLVLLIIAATLFSFYCFTSVFLPELIVLAIFAIYLIFFPFFLRKFV